jgi:hypothetical protein
MKWNNLMNKCLFLLTLTVLAAVLSGCNLPLVSQPTATALPTLTEAASVPLPSDTSVPATEKPSATIEPTATLEPSLTPTNTEVPSPTAFTAFTARVWANNVNLRTNPGYLFSVSRVLEEGAEFSVMGKSPGGEWLFVKRPDNVTGWVYTILVESDHDLKAIPVIQPTGVQTVTGRLLTTSGEPINGVKFAITQGSGTNAPRNDAVTDSDGLFIAFMPSGASGEWMVSFTSISCTSIVYDPDCNNRPEYAGTVVPESQMITLPYTGELAFTWQ